MEENAKDSTGGYTCMQNNELETIFYDHRCELQRARTYGGRSKTPVLLTNTIKTKISCVEIEMQNKIYSIASVSLSIG